MWIVISTLVSTATFMLILRELKYFRGDFLTQFLFFAIWARYVLSAFHHWTFDPFAANVSINALSSVTVALVGLIFIPLKYMQMKKLNIFYLMVFIILISGLINGEIKGLVAEGLKWLYFLSVALMFFRAIECYGRERVFRGVLFCFTTPVMLQVASIIVGYYKEGPDGSVSFIGGYFHEAVFSIVLLTTMYVVTIINWRSSLGASLIIIALFIGIAFTNYRTTMLAALPILFVYFWARADRAEPFVPRKLLRLPVLIGGISIAVLFETEIKERFADLIVILNGASDFIKNPDYYTHEEQDIFSARIYLWALYIQAFLEGNMVHKVLGFGPESYVETMPKHAHNTFISFLYEYGVVGLAILITWVGQNIRWALKSKDATIATFGVSGQIAFFLINLGTLPFWQIEGLIFYALLVTGSWQSMDGERLSEHSGAAGRSFQ